MNIKENLIILKMLKKTQALNTFFVRKRGSYKNINNPFSLTPWRHLWTTPNLLRLASLSISETTIWQMGYFRSKRKRILSSTPFLPGLLDLGTIPAWLRRWTRWRGGSRCSCYRLDWCCIEKILWPEANFINLFFKATALESWTVR